MTRGVFVATNVLPATELNDCFDPPRAHVYNSANISITTSGTAQAMTFDSELKDSGGMHSTSVNTSRLTIPAGGSGFYIFGGNVTFAANATGYRGLEVRLVGVTPIAYTRVPTVTTGSVGHRSCIAGAYPLTAGDYIELFAIQNSGGALDAVAESAVGISFWATWVAVA